MLSDTRAAKLKFIIMPDEILERLKKIEEYCLLGAKNVLVLDDVHLLTGLSKSHLYKLTCQKKIPYYKQSKMLYFNRGEIESWMQQNRVTTQDESEQRAIAHVVRKGGRL